uniref:Uncharacterized protein n=1 Tax=Ditylenchus dipsaci TaxID=166011 RepID=A0A915EFK0_9BILA
MKANYKGQIDQFIKQIMHLENTLQKKEQAARQDQDNGNMPRINALLAEKANWRASSIACELPYQTTKHFRIHCKPSTRIS